MDEYIVFDRSAGAAAFRDFRARVAGRRFDLVVALQVYLKAGVLTAMLDSPRKLGFDRRRARDFNWLFTSERIPAHEPQHVQDQYFEFLHHLGVEPVHEWRFEFSHAENEARRAFFDELDRPVLAVVVGTTRPGKNWFPERYARVLEVAEADLGLQSVIVGSENPVELAAAREVAESTKARPILALRNDLRRLAWLLDGSALMLSPDTGTAAHGRGPRDSGHWSVRLYRSQAGRPVPGPARADHRPLFEAGRDRALRGGPARKHGEDRGGRRAREAGARGPEVRAGRLRHRPEPGNPVGWCG